VSSLLVPSNSKYKTLQALSGRIEKIDSRASTLKSLRQSATEKDLRKRSLNFHNFATVFPARTEVAIGTLRIVKEERKIQGLRLRDILKILEKPDSEEYRCLVPNAKLLVDTASNHFREIPPKMYPEFVRILSENIDSLPHAPKQSKLLEKLLREFIKHIEDTEYSLVDVCNVLGYCRKQDLPINSTIYSRLLTLIEHSAHACFSLPQYFSHIQSGTLNNSDLRLLRILIRDLTSQLRVRRESTDHPQHHFLGRIGLGPELSSVPRLSSEHLLTAVKTLGRILTPSFRVPSVFYQDLCSFIRSNSQLELVDKVSTLGLFGTNKSVSRVCCSLIHGYLKSNKDLSCIPRDELEKVYRTARLVGFNHSFQLRRLERVLPPSPVLLVPHSLRDHQVSVDERFRRLLRLARYHRVRKVRRRMHALMGCINIGRVSGKLIRGAEFNLISHCSICDSFASNLNLARQFHV